MTLRRTTAGLLASGLVAAVIGVPFGATATAAPAGPTAPPAAPTTNTTATETAGAGSPSSATRAKLTGKHSLRSSVTDENFYFVMADRFDNGSTANDKGGLTGDRNVTGFDPTSKGFYNGGDLKGLLDKLDYIEGLGTDSIWLTPSFKNKAVQIEDGPSAGYHGYWVTDFTQIDPHLGSNAELKQLIDAAHGRGMKVYFDIITNHTADVIGYEEGARTAYVPKDVSPYETRSGREFDDRDYAGTTSFPKLDAKTSFPYTPVLDDAEKNVKVPSWLNDPTLYHNRGNTTFTGEDSQYGDFFGLDDLFTENPKVVDGMIEIYQTWISEMGIDGFRIDTMKHVDDAFWQKFGPAVLDYAHKHGKKDFFMFGEVFDTTQVFTSQYSTRNKMQATLDFPFQDSARNFASKGQSARGLKSLFLNDDWYTDADSNAYQQPTFLGNHDMGRIGYFLKTDNPSADEDELVARDKLAHELMYFSRGNPVIYYGDEQGFVGTGGDQGARQTLFASQVDEYQNDQLLGTDATGAVDNFNTDHPLYAGIRGLAALTKAHPALRDGAQQHRYASKGAGIYAFSRIDRAQQYEYVVAVNNAVEAKTANIPTYRRSGAFEKLYGDGPATLKAGFDWRLPVTVPALSTVVYKSVRTIPRSTAAPSVWLDKPAATTQDNSRTLVSADVGGSSFNEVTFYAKVGKGSYKAIGTDDSRPYRVYHDTSSIASGQKVTYRAVVRDNSGHQRVSIARRAKVAAPKLIWASPAEGADVFGLLTVQLSASPERGSHVVTIQQSLNGGAWKTVAVDRSSPVYSYRTDLNAIPENTSIRYRAILREPDGTKSVSSTRTVTRTAYRPLVKSVTVAGYVQSEMGCAADWNPACAESHLAFDDSDGVWKKTVTLPPCSGGCNPAGNYEWKVAIDDSWTVSYGENGGGDNIELVVPAGGAEVTFRWDQATKIPTATVE